MKRYKIDRLRFLIIDPNKHMHIIFREVLSSLGVRDFEFVKDTKEGLAILKELQPDVIITEMVMDPPDGIEFTRIVRSNSKSQLSFTPIVMATAYTEAGKVLAARDAGITEFMAKPISASALYRRIYSIIDAPRNFVRTGGFFGPDRRRRQGDQEFRRREADRLAEAATLASIQAQEAAEKAAMLAAKEKKKAEAEARETAAAKRKADAAQKAREEAERAASSQADVAAMLERNARKSG